MSIVIQPQADGPSGGAMILEDTYDLVKKRVIPDVAEISQGIRLDPINGPRRKDDLEFRIWTKFGGTGDAKTLGVRSSEGRYSAYFFETDGTKAVAGSKDLPAPRSPWTKLLFEVRSRLTTPLGLVRDPEFSLSRHEPLIVLEVFDAGEYQMVFYGHLTKFKDGKRLISVCEYLAGEFDVDLDCDYGKELQKG
ncbi:MAG: hypothetical protein QUS14_02115 [Pyrinomonadaceae bacterium]|nr:hypothetical protein [Pyrinomonadaceae bacterium]